MHALEFFQLAQCFVFRRLRHLGGFDLLAKLRDLFREFISFAELALNSFELLAQVKLTLRTIDVSACLSVDLLLDCQDFDLFVEQIVDASQTRGCVGNVEN